MLWINYELDANEEKFQEVMEIAFLILSPPQTTLSGYFL